VFAVSDVRALVAAIVVVAKNSDQFNVYIPFTDLDDRRHLFVCRNRGNILYGTLFRVCIDCCHSVEKIESRLSQIRFQTFEKWIYKIKNKKEHEEKNELA